MKVYRSHRASKVHFDPECPAWATSTATGPLQELEVAELKAAKFCAVCAPEPLRRRPRTVHARCEVCQQTRPIPCRHNGGVPVVNVDEMVSHGKVIRRVNTRWRWPENVLGATLQNRDLDLLVHPSSVG